MKRFFVNVMLHLIAWLIMFVNWLSGRSGVGSYILDREEEYHGERIMDEVEEMEWVEKELENIDNEIVMNKGALPPKVTHDPPGERISTNKPVGKTILIPENLTEALFQ